MSDRANKRAVKIIDGCGWIATIAVIFLAIAVCIGMVWFAVWLNT